MDSTVIKDYLKENIMYLSIVFFAVFILYVFFGMDFFSIFNYKYQYQKSLYGFQFFR
jgi:hypothetical protein